MENNSYGTFQICKNGDILTDQADTPAIKQAFCAQCGEQIISLCEHCQEPIRGRLRTVSVVAPPFMYYNGNVARPAFCHKCGKSFPWTARAQAALREMIEFSELSAAEKTDFQLIVPDLIVDTPRSHLAVLKAKTYLAKAGTETAKFIKDTLKEVATEAIKRAILGQ
jgi:hypothetical protein